MYKNVTEIANSKIRIHKKKGDSGKFIWSNTPQGMGGNRHEYNAFPAQVD